MGYHARRGLRKVRAFSLDGVGAGLTGRFAITYKQAFRANTSPLDGATFLDSSGLDYVHSRPDDTRGMAMKAIYSIGHNDALTLTSIDSSLYGDALCTTFTNPLPCGYGPGNFYTGAFHLFDVSNQVGIGPGSLTGSVFTYSSSTNGNFSNQIFDGTRIPFVVGNFSKHEWAVDRRRNTTWNARLALRAGQHVDAVHCIKYIFARPLHINFAGTSLYDLFS